VPKTKKQLEEDMENRRDEIIAEGNEIMRRELSKLPEPEKKIIYFCMSEVDFDDEDFMEQPFTIAEFCEACDFEVTNGDLGREELSKMEAAIKSASDKYFVAEYSNGFKERVRWIDTVRIEPSNGMVIFTLGQSIKPYLPGMIERVEIRKAKKAGYTLFRYEDYDMIMDQDISMHAKLIYLYFYSCSDEQGQCSPSHAVIAEKCAMSIRKVAYAIKELEKIEVVTKIKRQTKEGGQISNLYVIKKY